MQVGAALLFYQWKVSGRPLSSMYDWLPNLRDDLEQNCSDDCLSPGILAKM